MTRQPRVDPQSVLDAFVDWGQVARRALAPDAASHEIREGLRHPDVAARTRTARCAAIGPDLLDLAAGDPMARVREAVAKNSATAPETLHRLAGDRSAAVRTAVAAHLMTPPSARVLLAADQRVEVRRAVAKMPLATPVVERLADDPDPEVRAAITVQADLPEPVALLLAQDDDLRVRRGVARVRGAARTLDLLSADTSPAVVLNVATNPDASPDALRICARHPDELVRAAVARHPRAADISVPGAPGDLLWFLAADEHPLVRTMAAHHSCDVDTLEMLEQDESDLVRTTAANRRRALGEHAITSPLSDSGEGAHLRVMARIAVA